MSRLLHQKPRDPNLRAQIGLSIRIFFYKEDSDLSDNLSTTSPLGIQPYYWFNCQTCS